MSDNWITIIPEDPHCVPPKECQMQAQALMGQFAPYAEDVEIKVSGRVEFFDCGCNLERILCPSCRHEIAIEWWQGAMDADCGQGFKLERYKAPCCGAEHALNELVYDWPQGFGRFAIDVMNPGIAQLNEAQKGQLEQVLGTRIQIIYQHL